MYTLDNTMIYYDKEKQSIIYYSLRGQEEMMTYAKS